MCDAEEALLSAIRLNPDDDGPRLEYADWLDDHGQCERAQQIYLGVKLAGDPRAFPSREKWEEAKKFHDQLWKQEFKKIDDYSLIHIWTSRVSRGFIQFARIGHDVAKKYEYFIIRTIIEMEQPGRYHLSTPAKEYPEEITKRLKIILQTGRE